MANTLANTQLVLDSFIAHLENELVLANTFGTDFGGSFQDKGDTIDIRAPVRRQIQRDNLDVTNFDDDIIEGKRPIKLTKTATTKLDLTALERTLSITDARVQQYLSNAAVVMRDEIETYMASKYVDFYHFSGTPGTTPATFKSLASPGAVLTDAAIPMTQRYAFHSPDTTVELADGLKGVFVQGKAKTAFEQAQIGFYGGFDNMTSVHAPVHTVGAYGGTPLVNGGSQNVTYNQTVADNNYSDLVTDGWSLSQSGLLKKGDIITIADVFAVNPISKQSTGRLQTFVVKEDVDSDGSGNATLRLSPPIITSGAYQTVDAAPADGAAITVKTGAAGAQHRQSILAHRDAMKLVTRPLKIPSVGVRTATRSGNRVTMSITEVMDGNTLKNFYRMDMLYDVVTFPDNGGLRLTS